ncbi:glycosyltransferase family 8 protein [Curvularia clavata]|uniref:Glycosyltransferase family 8 protein n=1 Tax=Curvularia clavata TaxID=95742 RepID=A0A9Q8ZCE7_CURCL|nr:glycosyltransferase family 8 protein [Curvularia clavata]
MRRRHNIALATIACLGTILLVSQHSSHSRHVGVTHAYYDTKESNTGIEVLPSDLKASPQSQGAAASPQTDPKKHVTAGDDSSPAKAAPESPGSAAAPPEDKSVPAAQNGQTVLEAEFAFQKELDLILPIPTLQRFTGHKPHNYVPGGTEKYAYATFLATRNPSIKDPYFLAIHSLIYRLLWSPQSRTQKHPFIVYVAEYVTAEQRALLSGAGALVRELSPLPWHPNVPGVQNRWKDLFAKLNMWKETEFRRILFLDADAFPLANMDEMFDIPKVSSCIPEKLHLDDFLADGPVCEPYVFAGIPQDPFNIEHPNINVGSMVFTPSLRMHQRLLQNYVKTDKYDCLMAEQAFLNWQFGPETAFPATRLERQWGGFFPSEDEVNKLKVVHEKIWVAEGGWLKEEWQRGWRDMIAFYEGPEFAQEREKDGKAGG